MPVHSTWLAGIASSFLGKRSAADAGVALLGCQGSKTCTSPSKNDIFRHLWRLTYMFGLSLRHEWIDLLASGIFSHFNGHKSWIPAQSERPSVDTPVLISHKTAWLVHHAPQNLVQSLARHDYQIGARGISTQQRVARIRQALTDCGIPSDMLKTIDISVVFEFE